MSLGTAVSLKDFLPDVFMFLSTVVMISFKRRVWFRESSVHVLLIHNKMGKSASGNKKSHVKWPLKCREESLGFLPFRVICVSAGLLTPSRSDVLACGRAWALRGDTARSQLDVDSIWRPVSLP